MKRWRKLFRDARETALLRIELWLDDWAAAIRCFSEPPKYGEPCACPKDKRKVFPSDGIRAAVCQRCGRAWEIQR